MARRLKNAVRKNVPTSFEPDRTVKALLYARVSSKEQEKEGFSIPACGWCWWRRPTGSIAISRIG